MTSALTVSPAGIDQSSHNSGKIAGAAKDFEALMIGQMLKSIHEEGGWLGSDSDDAGNAASGLADEQLAHSMAANGGLGLSRVIESRLSRANQAATSSYLSTSISR